jgi:hypothetical protein
MQPWFHLGRLSSICGRVAGDDNGLRSSDSGRQAAPGGAVAVVVRDKRMTRRFYHAAWRSNGVGRRPAPGTAVEVVVLDRLMDGRFYDTAWRSNVGGRRPAVLSGLLCTSSAAATSRCGTVDGDGGVVRRR